MDFGRIWGFLDRQYVRMGHWLQIAMALRFSLVMVLPVMAHISGSNLVQSAFSHGSVFL